MNTTPRINANGVRAEITNPGCGRVAMDNVARAFWQSRMTLAGQRAEPIALVDLRQLAREIRKAVRA